MTHTLRSICVLILIQLCRAQDQTDYQPVEWYQAKVVTDDYSPQPIQEIFSTAKPLPSEPIVVLPTGTTAVDDGAYQVQGLPSPTPEQQSTVSSSPLPPEYTFTSTFSTQAPPQKEFFSTIPVKTTVNSSPPTFVTTNLPTQMPAFVQNQPVQYVQSGTIQLQNQTLRGVIFPLYQPQVTINNQETTPIRTSTTPVTFNTMPNQQTTVLRTTVPRMRTTLPQTTVSIQPRPTIILSPTPSTLSSTPSLQTATATVKNYSLPYPLTKIRVVAPSGSITNIKFVSSTTKSPPTTRTTRTPRTPRTRNTYKGCLDTCGKKTPICATPLAKQMNIDSLKGFPSICHMACHNSFKNNRYEKVIDGRCGKLRTHIRTLGSKKKLKKEDLQKNQYTVVKDNNNAIVEFESLF